MLAGFACPAVVPLTGHDSGAPVGGLGPDVQADASAPGPAAVANEADADVTVTPGRPGLRAPDAVTAPPAVPPAAAGLPDVPRPRRHRTGGAGGLSSPAVSCSFPTISATSAAGTAARRSAPSTGRSCWRATSIPNTTASGPRRPRHTRPRRRDRGGRPTRRPPPLPGDLTARLPQERPTGRAVHRHRPIPPRPGHLRRRLRRGNASLRRQCRRRRRPGLTGRPPLGSGSADHRRSSPVRDHRHRRHDRRQRPDGGCSTG